MQVTPEMIQNLAHLARLQFTNEEQAAIQGDLQKMIAFVEKLNELDTTGVEPLLHVGDTVNVLREDTLQGSVTREDALRNAPLQDGSFIKVPKVIKKA
jgi:aspartyl-tRNA(Asn)/glutamyl-tRNA(Gln) amidotransferase subunit C